MKYLAVSSSQKRASISFFANSKLILNIEAERDIQPSQWFSSAILLLTKIYDDLLKNLNFIAIDIGPGSFTGIKVGLAFVKGLVQKDNIPVVCINSLEANAVLGPENTKIAVVKNARRGLYYFALYEKGISHMENITEPMALTKEKVIENINFFKNLIIYTDSNDFVNSDNINGVIIKNYPPLSEGVGIIALERYKNGAYSSEKDIKPLYLREPDAVINLKLINKE